jgi:hypothetical protein
MPHDSHTRLTSHEDRQSDTIQDMSNTSHTPDNRPYSPWYNVADSQFTSQILRKHEEERQDLAKELQDTIAQLLIAAQIHLDRGQRAMPDPHPAFADARRLLTDAMQEIRTVINRLYPHIIEHYGTMAALQFLCIEFSRTHHILVRCTARGGTRVNHKTADTAKHTAHTPDSLSSESTTVGQLQSGIILYRSLQLLFDCLIHIQSIGIDNIVVVFVTQKRQLSLRVIIHHHGETIESDVFSPIRSYLRAAGGTARIAFFTAKEIHITMHIPLPAVRLQE